MANNVLDRSAMATLARLENELPHIGKALTELATGQEAIRQDQKEMTRKLSSLCRDIAVTTATAQRNTDDLKAQGKQIDSLQGDVAGLKAADRIIGAGNALLTAVGGTLLAIFGGN